MTHRTRNKQPAANQNTHRPLPENNDPKKLSREIGLEIASLCGKHFLKLKHLHYGYWPKDLEVDITNLHIAQEKYTDFLLANIPQNVKTILDVGCGSGQNAKQMINAGYNVDCVSPSPMLTQHTRNLLQNGCRIYEDYYENLQTENTYDLILFSESFQYINMNEALKKTQHLLNKDGCLLILDIFKNDVTGKSPLSGGHHLSALNDIIAKYPFTLYKNIDITEQTAPTIDIENKMLMKVGLPAWNLFNQLMLSRYPLMTKLLKWKYSRKIDKLYSKYFSDKRTAENFIKYKSYRLLIYRK